jgi:RimJ/RimL family protein N-acetyltransferase
MLFPLFTRERAAAFVARAQPPADPAAAADPARQLVLALADRADDAVVGLCGIVPNPVLEDGELWYLLRPERWGRGLVTEGVARLVEHAFRDLGLHRIWASCLPENPASARVLEKLGFRREGLLRRNLRIHGMWRDSWLYAVLADEWPPPAGPFDFGSRGG